MFSMTGYAKRQFEFKDYAVTIEIKSLNNKFLDIRFKMPPSLEHMESRLRKLLKAHVQRGKLDIFINVEAKESLELRIVESMINKYFHFIKKIEEDTGRTVQISLSEIIAMRSLFSPGDLASYPGFPESELEEAFSETVRVFQESRLQEGENTKRDILGYLALVAGSLEKIGALSPPIVERYKEQVREKIRELINGQLDEMRVMMEAGIFASKVDVSEEISRLRSHLKYFSSIADSCRECGRELDFVLQEMSREINTVGSKVPDYAVSEEVVSIKTNIEKIKEQVRNIE